MSETIIGAVMRTASMTCHIALAADGMAESHGAGCGHVPILTLAAQAWDEGWDAATHGFDLPDSEPGGLEPNPYRLTAGQEGERP